PDDLRDPVPGRLRGAGAAPLQRPQPGGRHLLPARVVGHPGHVRSVRGPAALPAVGTLLNEPGYRRLQERYPRPLIADAVRAQLAAERESGPAGDAERLESVAGRLAAWTAPRLRPVINGTGVVLHTNLGRAPIS